MFYNVNDYYTDVETFNRVAGNLNDITKEKLQAQARVLLEECHELINGIELDNKEEILDGAVDVTYVVFGMLQMLGKLGYNVSRAMERTADNNLTKFPKSIIVVVESVDDYADNGTVVTSKWNPYEEVYVLKDTNGKVRKPIGYVKNDLKDCLPNV